MTTTAADVRDILTVQGILNNYSDDGDEAEAIASLMDWREGTAVVLDTSAELPSPTVADEAGATPKGKRGKATESKDSDKFEASPDPSDEPDF